MQKMVAVIAAVFGMMTVFAGGNVIFSEAGAQAAGAVIPFVVWFNFLAGFAYVAAAVGIWQGERWGALLSIALVVAYLAVDGLLARHVLTGGEYEPRTLYAMTFRTVGWMFIAAWAYRRFVVPARRHSHR